MNANLTDLNQWLVYLSGPIGAGVWMLMVSNAIRNLREQKPSELNPDNGIAVWIRGLSPFNLLVFSFLVSVGIPAIAALVLALVPPELLAKAQPTFAVIAMLLGLYIGQQIWFKTYAPPGTITATTTGTKASVTVTPADPKADAAGR